MRIVLISTYELGHQPFGLASPAMWLKSVGAEVTCVDLAVRPLADSIPTISKADIIAFYLPMHTATRLAVSIIPQIKKLNQESHLCAYGLYAPVSEIYLRKLGVQTILGGEFEQGLVDLYLNLADKRPVELPRISLARQHFQLPDRSGLPGLIEYARVQMEDGDSRISGYTEASRGCKHTCSHCPIVPVYNGRFRIVQRDIVLSDIRQQVKNGASHIIFGDPDFFNGPGHAIPLVKALHQEYPDLTYDVIIKIEHLLKYPHYLPILKDTGCLFITSAVEAVDDRILNIFEKGHSRADFEQVVALCREVGLTLVPTFVSFTPWTTPEVYTDLLGTIDNLGLVNHVAPIQYAIRLLIPAGSKLLASPELNGLVGGFDDAALVYPWEHPDPRMDELYQDVFRLVKGHQKSGESRILLFERIWQAAVQLLEPEEVPVRGGRYQDDVVPKLSEDWY